MLKPGIYKHYKGNEYLLIGVAKHSETLEEMVIYKAWCGNGELWVRPLEIFVGDVQVDSKIMPRFIWVEEAKENPFSNSRE